MQKISKISALFTIGSLAILLDQLIKLIFIEKLPGYILCNAGIGFGLGFGKLGSVLLGSSVLVLVFLALAYFWRQKKKQVLVLPLVLVAGGAFSNLLDRFFRGCVIDYVNLRIWPSFNLADVLIAFGLAWAILLFLRADS